MFGKRENEPHGKNYDTQLASAEKGEEVSTRRKLKGGGKRDRGYLQVPLSSVMARKQIREDFDESLLQELADSFKDKGQLQPCTVFWSDSDGKYVIVAGERRFRAAEIAALEFLRVSVLPKEPTDLEHLEIQIIENVQREDLNPIEEAKAYKRLEDEFSLSQRQIAAKVGKGLSTVNRALGLLKLPAEIIDELAEAGTPRRLAEALLKLKTIDEQRALLERHRAGEVTVHQALSETTKANGSSRKSASAKYTREKKVGDIKLKASGKKKNTNTDYALATLVMCESLSTNNKATVDRESVATACCNLIRALGKGADAGSTDVVLEELRNVTAELERLQQTPSVLSKVA